MSNQLVITSGAKVRNLEGVLTGTSGVVNSVPLGAANGVATLDSGGKVPVSQLPSSVVTYLGTWNAATNTPTLTNGVGDAGDMYICNVAGTVNFGAGPITFAVGDWVLYGSGTWQKSSGQNGTVTSVGASITGNAIGLTGSPITTAGTLAFAFAGTAAQYINGAGNLVTFPSVITEAQRLITEVYNETGATLTKGTVVYINGGHGNLPTVTKAIATGDSTSAQTYGVVQNDITDNNNGYVVVIGSLGDLDTQAYAAGTQLYLSSTTAGAWTSTKQYAPAHLVYVGIVVRSHPTQGVVEIRIQNGFELDELHNVSAQTPTNNQGLFYNSSNQLWENKSIATALGYTPANDALVVHLSGDETITGSKTFSGLQSFTNTAGTDLTYGAYLTKNSIPSAFSSTTVNLYSASGNNNLVVRDNGNTSKLQFQATSSYTYTFPASTGTLALTTDIPSITGLVPYTGATTDVTLGNFSITGNVSTFKNSYIDGSASTNGQLMIKQAVLGSTNYAGYTSFYSTGTNISLLSDAGSSNYKSAVLSLSSLTNNTQRIYTLPNASGTLALTSDISYPVTSVFGRTGAVVATEGDYSLTQLSDVTITTPSSGQVLRYNGTSWENSTESYVGTVTSVGLSSATSGVTIGSSPITTSGTITLAIATASGSQQGLLSSTDWTTFNNKQNALTNPVTGTGTTNYLPKFTGTSTIGNSAFYEASGNLLIGSTTAGWAGTTGIELNGAETVLAFRKSGANAGYVYHNGTNLYISNELTGASAGSLIFNNNAGTRMTLTSTGVLTLPTSGSVEVGYSSIQGLYKLDVNGTGRYQTGANTSILISNDSVDTGYNIISLNGTRTKGSYAGIAGGGTGDNNLYLNSGGSVIVQTGSSYTQRLTIASTGAATFSSSVTAASMFVNTTDNSSGSKLQVYGSINFKGNSGYNGWIISQAGGNSSAAFNLSYGSGGAQNVITAQYDTGNVGINTTTDAGYKLDVNGTGRFSSSVTATEGKFSLDNGTEPTYTTGTAGKFIRSASGIYGGVRVALVGGSAGGDNGFDFYNTSTLVGQFGYGAGGLQFYFTKNVTSQAGFISHSDSYSPNGFYKLKPNPSITAARWWRITSDLVSYGDFSISQSLQNDDASYTSRLYINPAGATTITTATAAVGLTVNGGNSSDGTVGKFSRGGAEKNFYISCTNNQYVNLGTEGDFRFKTGVTVDQPYATGVNAMVITSTGNVGIGSSTFNYSASGRGYLSIGGSSDSLLEFQNSGTNTSGYILGTSTSLQIQISGPKTLSLNPNGGNVLIGTTTDEGYKLYVNGGSSNGMLFYSTSAANQIKAAGTAPAITFSNTITSPTIGGSLGSVTSANQFLTGTAAGDMILINQFTGNKLYITNYSGGVYLTQGATSWTANSDIRLKNINSYIENAVEKLSTLQTINFSYKDDKTNKQNLGLIAQEVEKIFPELIDKNGDGMLGVRYTELVPVLIKAIQEQQKEINELKLKIK